MKAISKVLGINLILMLLGFGLAYLIGEMKNDSRFFDEFGAMWIFFQGFCGLMLAGILYAFDQPAYARGFLLSTLIIVLIGFSFCAGTFI